MSVWQAIVMAIIEGITEFLPISSTAHLMLTAQMLGLAQTEFVKSFEIIIQLGAICSIAVLYAQKILKNPSLIWKIGIAFLPTGILGIFLYKFVKSFLLGNEWIAIGAMFLGGVLLLKFSIFNFQFSNKIQISNLSIFKLMAIGLFQSVAMIPGVSRSLATILGGQMVGLTKSEAVEMSFLLAVPTMAAATGFDLVKTGFNFSSQEWMILGVGFTGAFLSALVVVKWLVKFVETHDFKVFGWYRILLAMIWMGLTVFR